MQALPPDQAASVIPRAAATTLVLRDGAAGLEVLMVRRSPNASFMPGAYVFPGGAVDAADAAAAPACSETSAALARRIGAVTRVGDEALAYAVAALRECFEECGLWLGLPASASPPDGWEALRARLHHGEAFAVLASGAGLALATDGLFPWSHWVTPLGLPKRFDTLFFVVRAPQGQVPTVDLGETTTLAWVHPPSALAEQAAGRFFYAVAHELLGHRVHERNPAQGVSRHHRIADAAHAAAGTADAVRPAGVATDAADARLAEGERLGTCAEPRMSTPEPDVGLADRGYRPRPGERVETHPQYRARRSRERAEATVAAADRPLENPRPNAAQHGHGHARHGWQTTDAQQAERVVSGRFPDQIPSEAPGGPPRARASRFASPQAEAEALGRGRRALQRDLDAGAVPAHRDPTTSAPRYVDPVTGEPVRHEAVVTTQRPGGFGTSQVVRRQPPPSTALAPDAAGNRVAVPSSTPLPNATVVHEYVPSTGEWRPVSHYPEPAPLANGQMPIR